jgi:hypothetical protein
VNRIVSGIMFVALAGMAFSAQALGDYIRFTQAASGTVSATLTGFADPCNGSIVFPIGASSITLNGSEYDISSSFAILDPPACPFIPQPYQVVASLGVAADGHHEVMWTIGPLVVRGAFDVVSGVLRPLATDIPTLTVPAMAALFAMIAMIALTNLARVRRKRRR